MNPAVPKTAFCRSSFSVVTASITRLHDDLLFYFWHQSVPLSPAMCKRRINYIIQFLHKCRVIKTTKTKLPYTLYRRPLISSWPTSYCASGNRGQLSYRSLLRYTKHSIYNCILSFLDSSALHLGVFASFNTWTTWSQSACME